MATASHEAEQTMHTTDMHVCDDVDPEFQTLLEQGLNGFNDMAVGYGDRKPLAVVGSATHRRSAIAGVPSEELRWACSSSISSIVPPRSGTAAWVQKSCTNSKPKAFWRDSVRTRRNKPDILDEGAVMPCCHQRALNNISRE